MSWLRCPTPRPWATTRLVCFPHAGGSAVAYRSWSVSPAVEVHAVQYPGRADRMADPLPTGIMQTARMAAASLAPLQDRPMALFGHSMGALVAFETARILTEKGSPPVHLFVSAGLPAHKWAGRRTVPINDDAALVQELLSLGGSDADAMADPELRELVLPYIRADFQMLQDYRHTPGAPLTSPVTAMTGEGDPHVPVEIAAHWAELTTGPFELRSFSGDHFYLVERRDEVLAEIMKALNVPL
ncbi:thioesterase II family protein [Actinocorallia longicatena]|uniref:Alpha/beta fold hydrolase n=1 Tax=Actinocorallia longicatena TaxID=111803 RepID=A0ABP6QBJ8_9ACTN